MSSIKMSMPLLCLQENYCKQFAVKAVRMNGSILPDACHGRVWHKLLEVRLTTPTKLESRYSIQRRKLDGIPDYCLFQDTVKFHFIFTDSLFLIVNIYTIIRPIIHIFMK